MRFPTPIFPHFFEIFSVYSTHVNTSTVPKDPPSKSSSRSEQTETLKILKNLCIKSNVKLLMNIVHFWRIFFYKPAIQSGSVVLVQIRIRNMLYYKDTKPNFGKTIVSSGKYE